MTLFIERNQCPVCANTNKKVLIKKHINDKDFVEFMRLEPTYKDAFYNDLNNGVLDEQIFEVVKCLQCTFIYEKYVLNDIGMNKLYNVWMDHTTVDSLSGSLETKEKRFKYYQDRIFYIQNHFKKKRINILDWGAGLGNFCIAVKSVNNGDVYAYDYSTVKNNHLEQQGIITKPLNEFPEKHFHFINIDQVLEHVSDPLLLLKTTLKYITDDGLIFVSVPSCYTIEAQLKKNILDEKTFSQLNPHQHINAFTNKTLKTIGKKAGLKLCFEPVLQIRSTHSKGVNEYMKNILKPFYREWISTSLFFKRA
ncbi:MAG: class I SAM-dependent methyltransferase [Chitinophagaceae bacterium]